MKLRGLGYRLGREGRYFPERLKRRQRFRVATRPRVRRAQWAERAAIAAVAVLAVAAVGVVRKFPADRMNWSLASSLLPSAFRIDQVTFEESSPIVARLLDRETAYRPAPWGIWKPYSESRRLLRQFRFLASARPQREWKEHRMRFHLGLKNPMARVSRKGKPWGWLGDDGTLFQAPPEFFVQEVRTEIDLGFEGDSQARDVVAFLNQLSAGSFSARLTKMEFRSPELGWELTLENGGKVVWGDLRWTAEKLARLRQVLADAGSRGKVDWTPDLRFFGDGRIVLRPVSAVRPAQRAAKAAILGRSER